MWQDTEVLSQPEQSAAPVVRQTRALKRSTHALPSQADWRGGKHPSPGAGTKDLAADHERQGGTFPIRLLRGKFAVTSSNPDARDALVITLFMQCEGRAQPVAEPVFKKTRQVANGSIIVTRPKSTHASDVQNDIDQIAVLVPLEQLRNLLRRYSEGAPDLLETLYDVPFKCPMLQGNILRLWQECKAHGATSDLEIDSLVLSIVSSLVSKAKHVKKDCAIKLPKPTLRRIDAYIHENCEDGIKTADLAKIAGLSPCHFSRSFRASTGETPHRYVTKHRLEQAIDKLSDDSIPLAEIAFGCGFSSQSHMTQIFRAWFGLTPRQMRIEINDPVSELESDRQPHG